MQPRLLDTLSEHLYYDEIAIPFTRMQNECKQLISSLADAHIEVGNRVNNNVFTIDQANDLVSKEITFLILEHKMFVSVMSTTKTLNLLNLFVAW